MSKEKAQRVIDELIRRGEEAEGECALHRVQGYAEAEALLRTAFELPRLRECVNDCPTCEDGTKGHYEGHILYGGRGVYVCPACGTRWQNAEEEPSRKAVPVVIPGREDSLEHHRDRAEAAEAHATRLEAALRRLVVTIDQPGDLRKDGWGALRAALAEARDALAASGEDSE